MDADFSHDPADLPAADRRRLRARPTSCSAPATSPAAASATGAGAGGRSAAGAASTRGPGSGSTIQDLTGGFKCFRREVLEAIDLDTVGALGYAFQVEMTYRAVRAGFRVVEVPIVFRDRRVGESKMSRAIVARGRLAGAGDAAARQR